MKYIPVYFNIIIPHWKDKKKTVIYTGTLHQVWGEKISYFYLILDDPLICWISLVTEVYDDIDASIQEGVKDSN